MLVNCYRRDTPPSLRGARIEGVMRLVSRGILLVSELIAQQVFDWTLAAIATVAMLAGVLLALWLLGSVMLGWLNDRHRSKV